MLTITQYTSPEESTDCAFCTNSAVVKLEFVTAKTMLVLLQSTSQRHV